MAQHPEPLGTLKPRATLAILSSGIVLMSLTGCGHERDYAVPSQVCGAKTDPDLLEPLLPTGTKLRNHTTISEKRQKLCNLDVVRNQGEKYSRALQIQWDIVPAGTDPIEVKRDTLRRYGNPRQASIGNQAQVADHGALAVQQCPGQGKGSTLVVELYASTATPKNTSERRDALEAFTRAYLKRALIEGHCVSAAK